MSKQMPGERSQRQLRVAEQIRHVLVEVLQREHLHDEDLLDAASKVTISEVRISPDLKNATAFAMPLLDADIQTLIPALNKAAGYFQKEIGNKLTLKFTPRIKFVYDKSIGEADKIEQLLRKIHEENNS